MYHDIVDSAAVVVAALDGATACFPNLDGAILGACDHPLALAVECDARDVARVALEGQQGVGIGRFDVEELDGMVAGGREEALVGGDTQAVDLRVGMLDCAGADARESLPEPVLSVRDRGSSQRALGSEEFGMLLDLRRVESRLRFRTYRMVWSYPASQKISLVK